MRKVSFAVLPSSSFSRDGSCRPGTCTRMRSTPWRWIERLDGAELVDAPLDDLDRLLDRLADALDDGGLGRREPDHAVAGVDHVDRALAGGAQDAAERLRQFAQLGERELRDRRPRGCGIRRVLPRIVAAAGLPSRFSRTHAAHVVAQRLEPSPCAPRWCRPRAGCASRPAGRGRARDGAAPTSATTAPSSRERNSERRTAQTRNVVSRIAVAFQREK